MSRVRFGAVMGAVALVVSGVASGSLRAQGTAAPPSADAVARGAYIVEEVAQCGRCHTPVDRTGERDRAHKLTGGPLDFSPSVARDNWAMTAPRIAGTPPGTDEQFLTLLTTGISRTGLPMRRPMPQFHMTRADAEAVLAYLKSLGGTERRGR